MRITLKVYAVEYMGEDTKKRRSIKLTLKGQSEGTIYEHVAFMHLPWEQAQGIRLGQDFELCSIGGTVSDPHVESRLERGVKAATESVDRVCGGQS